MDPFDAPPSTPPVSFRPPADQPQPPEPRKPSESRGWRTALAIGATAVLVGGGALGVSSLVAADDDAASAAPDDEPADDQDDDGSDEPADDESDDGDGGSDEPADDGGDGGSDEPTDDGSDDGGSDQGDDGTDGPRHRRGPFVFDLDDLERLEDLDEESLQEFQECVGLPALDFMIDGELPQLDPGQLPDIDPEQLEEFESLIDEFLGEFESMLGDTQLEGDLDELLDGELGELFGDLPERQAFDRPGVERPRPHRVGQAGPGAIFGDDDLITITGPDGVTVIDLGDGDGSVTIARDADTGEVTVTTEGTASEGDLSAVFDFELPEDLDDLEIPEFDFDFEGGPFGDFDPDKIQDCLDDLS